MVWSVVASCDAARMRSDSSIAGTGEGSAVTRPRSGARPRRRDARARAERSGRSPGRDEPRARRRGDARGRGRRRSRAPSPAPRPPQRTPRSRTRASRLPLAPRRARRARRRRSARTRRSPRARRRARVESSGPSRSKSARPEISRKPTACGLPDVGAGEGDALPVDARRRRPPATRTIPMSATTTASSPSRSKTHARTPASVSIASSARDHPARACEVQRGAAHAVAAHLGDRSVGVDHAHPRERRPPRAEAEARARRRHRLRGDGRTTRGRARRSRRLHESLRRGRSRCRALRTSRTQRGAHVRPCEISTLTRDRALATGQRDLQARADVASIPPQNGDELRPCGPAPDDADRRSAESRGSRASATSSSFAALSTGGRAAMATSSAPAHPQDRARLRPGLGPNVDADLVVLQRRA